MICRRLLSSLNSKTLCCILKGNFQVSSVRASSAADKNIAVIKSSISEAEEFSKAYCEYADSTVNRWSKAKDIYYGKDRDLVNFPDKIPPKQPEMRWFFRKSWFDAFYNKTGATGPYIFLAVPTLALLSKELLVMNGEFGLAIIRGIAIYYLYNKYSPRVHKWLDDQIDPLAEKHYYGPIKVMKANLMNTIKTADDGIHSNSMVPKISEAKKENLQLQQESIYRERLVQVHRTVKQQLDYMVMHEAVKRRTQQEHLINWVMKRIHQSVTPQMEKDVLNSCIAQLKHISKAQPA